MSNSKSNKGNLKLRRVCEVAKEGKGWEKVRKLVLSHSPVETQTAIFHGKIAIHLIHLNEVMIMVFVNYIIRVIMVPRMKY